MSKKEHTPFISHPMKRVSKLPDKINRFLTKHLIKKFYAEKVLNNIDIEYKERQKIDLIRQ